jgi:hypothetical protein
MNKSSVGSIRKGTHKSLGRAGRGARVTEITIKSKPLPKAAASRRQGGKVK